MSAQLPPRQLYALACCAALVREVLGDQRGALVEYDALVEFDQGALDPELRAMVQLIGRDRLVQHAVTGARALLAEAGLEIPRFL